MSYLYGMKATNKSKKVEQYLEALAGRSTSITNDKCVAPPFGCGQPVGQFKDELSKREYRISGLCQKCQDKIFG